MPSSMYGIKLAAAVRDMLPPIKLVIVSGHSLPTLICRRAQFFRKPYRSNEIISTLRELPA